LTTNVLAADILANIITFPDDRSISLLKPSLPPLSSLDVLQLLEYAESSGANVLTCSVLGSFLAQEVVKAVSRTGEPGFNVFVFNANLCEVKAIPIA